MADKLWHLTHIHPPQLGIVDIIGGLPNDGGSPGWNINGDNGMYSSNSGDVTVVNGRFVFNGAPNSYVQFYSYPWQGSTARSAYYNNGFYPGEDPTFTLEAHLNITGDGIIFESGAGWPGIVPSESYFTKDRLNDFLGMMFQVRSGRLYIQRWADAVEVDTGLDFSGETHFMFQHKQFDDYFIIGVGGSTFKTPFAYVGQCYDGVGFFASYDSTFTTPDETNPHFNAVGTMGPLRLTAKRRRYDVDVTGTDTYTPPAFGYPGETSGSGVMSCDIAFPPSSYGFTDEYDDPRYFSYASKPIWKLINLVGGTPPYTYEWVDMTMGDLQWAAIEIEVTKPSLQLDMQYMSEDHSYWIGCIVTDSVGEVATTWIYQQGVAISNDENFRSIHNGTHWANVGDKISMRAASIQKCASHFNRCGDWQPFTAGIVAVTRADPESIPTNGTLVAETIYSAYINDINTGEPGTGAPLGAFDTYRIDAVEPEDNGLVLTVIDYTNTSPLAGQSREVTLIVKDGPATADGFGWWTQGEEIVQTTNVGVEAAFRTRADGVQAALDTRADPETIESSVNSEMYIWDAPQNRGDMTDYDAGFLAAWFVSGGSSPWTWWATTASARIQAWDYNSDQECAYLSACDRAWNAKSWDPANGPTFLPETGSVFQEVYNATYAGAFDGWDAGRKDKLAVNPKYTTTAPQYTGLYPDEYLNGFDELYEQGYF